MLIDSPAHEFPLANFRDFLQLFICSNDVALPFVLDRFELQQTQILAFFLMLVGFLPDLDRWPIRDNVGSL